MRIALCVWGVPRHAIERTEFYRQDLEILSSLGHEVVFVNSLRSFRKDVDLAVVWWWNYLWLWGPLFDSLKVPVIATGTFDVQAYPALPWWKRALKRWGVRYPRLHVAVSQSEFAAIPGCVSVDPRRMRYSPHVIDTGVYRPGEGSSRGADMRILNVSWQRVTNMRRKMVPELLEAFALFRQEAPEARLILAGPPEDGAALLTARARQLGLEECVEFPGEISREEKVRLMRTCWVYCQVSRYEGFGVAIAEAMACGAPVLVSRSGAVPEVVGDCGGYVDSLDVQGILRGLRSIRQNYADALKRAENGVERVGRLFSVERRREDFRRFIAEVLAQPRG